MTKISQKRRQLAATVHDGKKAKFPVDSVKTATSALHLLNNAKPPLSPGQRARVITQAHRYAPGKAAPAVKAPGKAH